MKKFQFTLLTVLVIFGLTGCESKEDRMLREMTEARENASQAFTEEYEGVNEVYHGVLVILQSVIDQETAAAAIPEIKAIATKYKDAGMTDIPVFLGDPSFSELNKSYEEAQNKKALIQAELSRIGELGGKGTKSYDVSLCLNTGMTLEEYLKD